MSAHHFLPHFPSVNYLKILTHTFLHFTELFLHIRCIEVYNGHKKYDFLINALEQSSTHSNEEKKNQRQPMSIIFTEHINLQKLGQLMVLGQFPHPDHGVWVKVHCSCRSN